jgi:hypothetical protein
LPSGPLTLPVIVAAEVGAASAVVNASETSSFFVEHMFLSLGRIWRQQ